MEFCHVLIVEFDIVHRNRQVRQRKPIEFCDKRDYPLGAFAFARGENVFFMTQNTDMRFVDRNDTVQTNHAAQNMAQKIGTDCCNNHCTQN